MTTGNGYLDEKVGLVTGAARGIGRAIALELAYRGASLPTSLSHRWVINPTMAIE